MQTTTLVLVDSHLHLQDSRIWDQREELLYRAGRVGVRRLMVNGSRESDWPRVLELGLQHPQIVPYFGLHPWHTEERSAHWLEHLESFLLQMPSGVGEIGLRRRRPRQAEEEAEEEEVFLAQWRLAQRLRRPVTIHCLSAWDRLTELLTKDGAAFSVFLLHAYSGPPERIPALAALGARFSFAGNLLGEREAILRRTMAAVPLPLLLLESDAPNLPAPNRYTLAGSKTGPGQALSEPADLAILYRETARIRQEEPEVMAAALWNNCNTLLQTIL